MTAKDFRRLLFLAVFLFLLFCFIVIQFFKLQIIEGDKWSRQAKAQHQFSVVESFNRGRFFSNPELKEGHPEKAVPLVFDVKRYHLFIDPLAIPIDSRDGITSTLAEIFALNGEEKNRLRQQFDKRCRSRRVHMWIEESGKKVVEKWWKPFAKGKKIPRSALYFVKDYQRAYPYGQLLGAVIHTVRDDRDLITHQALPTGGLELFFDSYLQGKAGRRLLLRSPSRSFEGGLLMTHPEDGADVYLSIDHHIQAIAEEEVKRAVKISGAKSGWAVMMNPNTGEIYALAQHPGFDPSDYREYYNDPERVEATRVHAITDCFEPGSTMKPISIAIAMLANEELKRQGKEAIFDPADMMPAYDGTFPGRKRLVHDVGTHRFLNMYLAVQKSSNIYIAKLIKRIIETLGNEWYRRQLEEVFGFGVATGIEFPGESPGLLPTPNKRYSSGRLQWSTPTPYSLSFGYNLLANSIQVMRAFAIIANGGYSVQPTLLKKIVKNGEVIFDHGKRERKQVLSLEISRELICALKAVTKPGGAGVRADIPGYTEAGKTGTAEKVIRGVYSKRRHFGSFIGFAPADHPQFLLYVAIDDPEYRYLPGIGTIHFGGRCAAPPFRRIMQRTFNYLGIPPDDPHGYPRDDPRFNSEKADWNEQVNILKELYTEWN